MYHDIGRDVAAERPGQAKTVLTLILRVLREVNQVSNTFIQNESFKYLPAVRRNRNELSIIQT